MMEESSDESAEMITKEEVETAEAEQSQSSFVPHTAGVTPGLPAQPAPLPDFVTRAVTPTRQGQSPMSPQKPTTPPVTLPSVQPVSPQAVLAPVTLPSVQPVSPQAVLAPVTLPSVQPVSPQAVLAPGPVESPYEASSSIIVPDMEVAPSSPEGLQGGLFGWLAGNKMLSRVVEKTKTSMESMITTLDPGMREVLRTGGDVHIIVASTKDSKVAPIREAFQQAFGRATVTCKESPATMAAQPVGFTAGLKGAQERIQNLRKLQDNPLEDDQTIVSVEGFIVEMLPNRWYELSCLLLQDPEHGIDLQNFSQPSPIPPEYIVKAQDRTPSDYPLRWSGLAVTMGQLIEESHPHIGHSDWQNAITGVSRRESLFLAAKSLAYMYKQRLPTAYVS